MTRWRLDPFGDAVGRPTRLLAGLWTTGGLLMLLWAAFGVRDRGEPAVVVELGLSAVALGAGLFALRSRQLPHVQYVALTLLGSAVVSAVLWWSGSAATGAPAILFVYVGVFSGVALGRSAWPVLAVSAAMHAGILGARQTSSGLGEWLVIWGATVVASVLIGAAMTENRRITAERERLVADLRTADETKTAFLQAVGHDLTTPAAVIVGLARTVLDHDDDLGAERRRDLLERIAANTERLHRDLDALLQLEQLRPGRLAVTLESTLLDALITDAVVRADVDPDRIERHGTGGVTLAVDAIKLEHALANLLSNAAKYGGGGTIAVRAVDGDGRTVLSVDDRGPGVPEDLRERIFEPLQRARDEDWEHGSGIGLSVVRAFARFHGGESWVEDAPGGGARFCISVPAAAPRRR